VLVLITREFKGNNETIIKPKKQKRKEDGSISWQAGD